MPARNKDQIERFKKAARELGADELFDEALRRIGKAPPPKLDKPAGEKPAPKKPGR